MTREETMRRMISVSAMLVILAVMLICSAAAAENVGGKVSDILAPLESEKKAGNNNPLYTQRFGADPGAMEYEGRVYVYMTDDVIETDAQGNVKENSYSQIRGINCISSADLVNWTDHGRIPVAGKSGIAGWATNSWAPCAAHKTIDGKEKFFLYFCNGGNGIGVLSADSPAGPWRDELGGLLISRQTPKCADVVWLFDPAVMVDEDGTGYLAFGGGIPEGKTANPGTARIVRLGEDMMSLDGEPVVIDAPYLFEDSGINRINGKYVYSYCSNWQTKGNDLGMTDAAIEYMVSDDPMGPYEWDGELFLNEGRFFGLYGNNHHSIVELNGELYLLYHSRPVEQARGITGNYRSPQIDRVPVQEDGSLGPVTGTMKGVEQLMPLDPSDGVPVSTMSRQAGISVAVNDRGVVVSGKPGAWMRLSDVDFGEGIQELTVSTSSMSGGSIYVTAGEADGEILAEINVGAGYSPETITVPLKMSGISDLCFVFDGNVFLYENWTVK